MKFRRQHPVGPWILDFYCVAERLAVEVDGQTHHAPEGIERDRARDAWLNEQGIRVLRFTAQQVLQQARR